MTKALFLLTLTTSSTLFSPELLAHNEHSISVLMHSVLHNATNIGVTLALLIFGFVLYKQLPKMIKQGIKK